MDPEPITDSDESPEDSPIEELAGFSLATDPAFHERVRRSIRRRETAGHLMALGSVGFLTVLLEFFQLTRSVVAGRPPEPTNEDPPDE